MLLQLKTEGETLADAMPQLSKLLLFTLEAVMNAEPFTRVTAAGLHCAAGGVLSFTVTVCVQDEEFPEASVTIHITCVLPNPKTAGALFVPAETLQLSDVAGTSNVTVAVHPADAVTAISAGHTIEGASVSLTVTEKLQVAVLDEASVTINVFTVVPIGKVVPDGSPVVWPVTAVQLSVPEGSI
jgi:hypothetical protein